MKILAIATAAILVIGLLVNVWMLHMARNPLTPSRVGLAALVCIAVSAGLATAAMRFFWGSRCDPPATCDYASLLEGGMTWPAMWLSIYAVTYLVTARLLAHVQRRRHPF